MKSKKPLLAIAGTGLIGCSIALALRKNRYCNTIVGFDTSAHNLENALKSGAVDIAAHSLACAINNAEVLILSAPVSAIISSITEIGKMNASCKLILDTGSLKVPVMAAASRARLCNFVGGHPMSGLEKSGPLFAKYDLFKNRTFFLTRTKNTSRVAFELAKKIVCACDAIPFVIDAKKHDKIVALTSHLPYLLAVALMELATSRVKDFNLLRRAVGSSFADLTRVAESPPWLGTDMLYGNATNVKRWFEKLSCLCRDFTTKSRRTLLKEIGNIRTIRHKLFCRQRGFF